MQGSDSYFVVHWRAVKGNDDGGDHPCNHWLSSPMSDYDPIFEDDRLREFSTIDDARQAIKKHCFDFGEFRITEVKWSVIGLVGPNGYLEA